MKRCPECHFTFEDYEERCDFDGSELVPVESSESNSAKSQPIYIRFLRSRLGLAVLALIALLISSLVIGYFDAASEGNVEAPKSSEKQAS